MESNFNTLTSLNSTYAVRTLEEANKLELSADQYLVRKIERNTGLDSKAVVIPATDAESFTLALNSDVVLGAAVAWFQQCIGEVVKSKMTAGKHSIVAADFSMEEIEKYLAEQEVREGRISKEKIGAWFDSTLVAGLNQAFQARLGTQYTESVQKDVIESYRKQFQKLSGKELLLETEVKGSLLKACSIAPEGSAVRAYCEGKIKEAKLPSSMLSLL